MKVCFGCRDKYFAEWNEIGEADKCEVCERETEVCEVTAAGLRNGLFLHKVVQTDGRSILVFTKNKYPSSSKEEKRVPTTTGQRVRTMTVFGKS